MCVRFLRKAIFDISPNALRTRIVLILGCFLLFFPSLFFFLPLLPLPLGGKTHIRIGLGRACASQTGKRSNNIES